MPRRHRGPGPEDSRQFSAEVVPTLVRAAQDLSWLLGRGYRSGPALRLIGERLQLTVRQRTAVRRCACSDQALARRAQHRIEPADLAGQRVAVDGYNVLTSVEAALGGGLLLLGRDGCLRDMVSMSGAWRRVEETTRGATLVGEHLEALGVTSAAWYLDRPVSNSGRLRALLLGLAERRGWPWTVELAYDPDAELAAGDAVACSADSVILDRCTRWFNLAWSVLEPLLDDAWLIDLGG